MLKGDIFTVSETPRADQIDYIKQVWKPNTASYQQVISEINTMLSHLQYFVADLDMDNDCIHDNGELVLSKDDYQK
eukprot:11193782-Ditylum_brightwellii.AAC.1